MPFLLFLALFAPQAPAEGFASAQAQRPTQAATNHCAQFAHKPAYLAVIDLLAKRMKYSTAELCSLPTLTDIFISERDLFHKETQTDEPHTWVTLHYNEYSCQYFVRKADQAMTQKNCYNTW